MATSIFVVPAGIGRLPGWAKIWAWGGGSAVATGTRGLLLVLTTMLAVAAWGAPDWPGGGSSQRYGSIWTTPSYRGGEPGSRTRATSMISSPVASVSRGGERSSIHSHQVARSARVW